MPKVSVILPSLNVAVYIRETIESVINQTLQEIEIICVDAGSTDGTLEILQEYAEKDSRIKIIHSDKKSYGYQMNIGMQAALGEYIGIVETDDYIERDMYEILYDTAAKNNADIVKSDFDMFTTMEDGRRLFCNYSLKRLNQVVYDTVYSCDAYLDGKAKVECYIWNAVYKREFLEDFGVKFNETPGASFQDFGFKFQTSLFAKRIVAVNQSFYRYRRDNSGSSTYNPRTAEYNLRESKFLLSVLEGRGIEDKRVYSAVAKEITEYAFWPYVELLKWNQPAESTKDSFDEYRKLMRVFVDNEWIERENFNYDLWLSANLLLEGRKVYLGYADVVARLQAEKIIKVLKMIKSAKSVIIFGSGIRGKGASIFFMNNGVKNLTVFCDNDEKKWRTSFMDLPIISPKEAVSKYPDALFVISSSNLYKDMKEQLVGLGIAEMNILKYDFINDPFFCTNCMVQNYL